MKLRQELCFLKRLFKRTKVKEGQGMENTNNKKFTDKVNTICLENADKELISYYKDDGSVEKWTYRQFHIEVEKMVHCLEESPIQKGDRVLVLDVLSPYACRLIIALAVYGVTSVILDGKQPLDELYYLVGKSDIRAIYASEQYYEMCAKEFEKNIPVYNIMTCDQFCDKKYAIHRTIDPDEEVMAILYSSGTTSEPKGIMITYEGQLHSSKYLLQAFGTTDIRYLVVFPLYHVSGFSTFLAIFLGGGQIGLLENTDSAKLLAGFQKYRPNAFGMVPKVYETFQKKIVEQMRSRNLGKIFLKMIDFSGWLRRYLHLNIGKVLFKSINQQLFGGNMKYLGVGGGPVTEEVSIFFQNLGYRWMNTYASTELNLPMATTTSQDNYPMDSVGNIRNFNGIDIRIQNPDSEGRGEIQIKSTCCMKGYFRDAESTRKAYEEDYFKTGDIGYIDKRGYLYVTGRSKESIYLQNGEKISPERVEALYSVCIPENVIAVCSGVKNEKKGYDDIVYFVEKSNLLDELTLKHAIMEQSKRIGGNYRIANVCFVDKIPLSSIGKVQRYKLQNMNAEMQESRKNTMDEEERSIYSRIVQILKEVGVKEDILKDSILERDLGLDSLNLFELCVGIENVLHVPLYDYISSQLTVNELCELVENGKDSMGQDVSLCVARDDFAISDRSIIDKIILFIIIHLSRKIRKYNINGDENFVIGKNYIICSNHASYFDPIWILAALKKRMDIENIITLAAEERSRDSKRFFRMLGCIPVDRNKGVHPEIKYVEKCLKKGMNAIIFPEGARTRDGSLMNLKRGIIKISKNANIPILPIHIEGNFEIFPRHLKYPRLFDWKKHKRFVLKIDIRKPIYPNDLSDDMMMEELRNKLI